MCVGVRVGVEEGGEGAHFPKPGTEPSISPLTFIYLLITLQFHSHPRNVHINKPYYL